MAEGSAEREQSEPGLNDWCRKNFIFCDLLVALASALMLIAAYARHPFFDVPAGARTTIYSTAVSLCGTLAGFLISAVSIVFAMSALPQLEILKKAATLPILYRVYFDAIGWLAVATVCSGAGMLLDSDTLPRAWIGYLLMVLLAICGMKTYRCVLYLYTLTRASLVQENSDLAVPPPERDSAFG